MDYLASALALGALLARLHHAEGSALCGHDRTRALAVGADLGGRAFGTACALTIGALLDLGNENVLLDTEGSLLELYVDSCTQIIALAGCIGVSAAATAEAEAAAEDVAEDISEVSEAAEATAAKAAANALKKLGGKYRETRQFTLPDSSARGLVLCRKISQTPTQFPRKSKKISTKPL